MTDLGQAVADADRRAREEAAKSALSTVEYLSAPQLELLTGTPASTWRYWAHLGTGPASLK